MKTKTLVAYEAESSVTLRLTPAHIGKLLSQVPANDLADCLDALKAETIYMPAPRVRLLGQLLIETGREISVKSRGVSNG